MATLETAADAILTDELLARFDERAPDYDAANTFFQEDFDELREAGYLDLAIPPDFGGPGLTLAQVGRLQRRLAYVAPATAVAINMHLYWTGVAAELYRAGDTSLAWLLEETAAGHVFAAGHGEPGNDVPLFLSTTRAERVDGGWRFTGRKIFGSLSPVWTYLGLHGMDTSRPGRPAHRPRLPGPRRGRLPDRAHLGHARHARDREPGHDPRRRVRPRRAGGARLPRAA